jgi:hypothetical protein
MQSEALAVRLHCALGAMLRVDFEDVISAPSLSASVATRHQAEMQELPGPLTATFKSIGSRLSHFPTDGGLPPKALQRLLVNQVFWSAPGPNQNRKRLAERPIDAIDPERTLDGGCVRI